MSEGAHHYSEGIEYHEHHGLEVKVLGGQEMVYILGSESKNIVGAESKFILGVVADVGLATKVVVESTAEVMWVGGKHFVMAAHGGGVFDGVFSATAGFDNPAEFKKIKWWLRSVVIGQVLAVAISAAFIKTIYKPKENKHHEIEVDANSGFYSATTINAQLLALITLIQTIWVWHLTAKQEHATPISAVTVTKQGYAFLGVSASQASGATATGSAGLELSPLSFKLSWADSKRKFEHQGHHVFGYEVDKDKSKIVGNENGVSINSTEFKLSTAANATSVDINAKPSSAKLDLKVKSAGSNSGLKLKAGGFKISDSGGSSLSSEKAELKLQSAKAAEIGSLTIKNSDVLLQATGAGPAPAQAPAQAPANAAAQAAPLPGTAQVHLTPTSLVMSTTDNNKITLDVTGVNIAGALTILNPGLGIPNAAAIAKIADEKIKENAENIKEASELAATQLKEHLEKKVSDEVAKAISALDQKIVDASAVKGANPT